MAKKRRKKTATTGRVTVSKSLLVKAEKAIAAVKRTVKKAVTKRRKTKKKTRRKSR